MQTDFGPIASTYGIIASFIFPIGLLWTGPLAKYFHAETVGIVLGIALPGTVTRVTCLSGIRLSALFALFPALAARQGNPRGASTGSLPKRQARVPIQVKSRTSPLAIWYSNFLRMFFFPAAAMLVGGAPVMAIEEPFYRVLEKDDAFELREYAAYIVAETDVAGDFENVGSEGFRRLAGYIGGKNRPKASIPMTAPVSQQPASEKVPMTAPVSQERKNGGWRIAFTMPSTYTIETLPEPDDDRIGLREEKPKTVAVIRYSGTWSKKRYDDHEKELMNWISRKGWEADGAPVWARYNPPFVPWFLRRNEILIPVNSR